MGGRRIARGTCTRHKGRLRTSMYEWPVLPQPWSDAWQLTSSKIGRPSSAALTYTLLGQPISALSSPSVVDVCYKRQ